MKKSFIVILLIFISFYLISNYIENKVAIPKDSIRIRIIANSNEEYDQKVKNMVKDNMQVYLYELLKDATNSYEAVQIVNENLDNIDSKVNGTLQSVDYNYPYNINFGLNYFPQKIYKGIEYDPGYYKSLLVTLGNGEGDNWWCVLFPPLCLIEAEESTEIEYKSFVKELIDKYV